MNKLNSGNRTRRTDQEFSLAVAQTLASMKAAHGGEVTVLLEVVGVEGVGRLTIRAVWTPAALNGAALTAPPQPLAVSREYPNSDNNTLDAAIWNLLVRLDYVIGSSAYRQMLLDGSHGA